MTVGFPLKANPFKEKITNIKVIDKETMKQLDTANASDFYPVTLSLNVFIDFFNIEALKDYIISVNFCLPDGTFKPVLATNMIVGEDILRYKHNNVGKITGNIEFDLTIDKPTDFFLHFMFISGGNPAKALDDRYEFFYFGYNG